MRNLLWLMAISCAPLCHATDSSQPSDEPKMEMMVSDPADAAILRTMGFKPELLDEEQYKNNEVLTHWPAPSHRNAVLKAVPALRDYAERKHWDDLELDTFIFKAGRKNASPEALKGSYPDAAAAMLESAVRESTKALSAR